MRGKKLGACLSCLTYLNRGAHLKLFLERVFSQYSILIYWNKEMGLI